MDCSGLGFGRRVVRTPRVAGGLFAHRGLKSRSEDLGGFGMYSRAYYTRIKGLATSRTIFHMVSVYWKGALGPVSESRRRSCSKIAGQRPGAVWHVQ